MAVFEGITGTSGFSLAGPLFDAATGELRLRGDAGDNAVRQALSPSGFLELTFDGRPYSSDPASAFFDRALAGASAATLAAVHFDGGGGQDTLTLGAQQLPGRFAAQAPNLTVDGTLVAAAVSLHAEEWLTIETAGQIVAGWIDLTADRFANSGQLRADGGAVAVDARNVLHAGRITADAGAVRVAFTGSYIDTATALTSATGGRVAIDGGTTGRLFSSGKHQATGAVGGAIDLLGRAVLLVGATVDASGNLGGGSIRIGGDFQGRNPNVVNAQTVTVTAATAIRADALQQGDGGRVVVWADQETEFAGSVSARGGPAGGAGRFIEVSAKGNLSFGGSADAAGPKGNAGTLLLDPKNLVISDAAVGIPQYDLLDPNPNAGGHFGATVTVLSNGNVVVTDPNDNLGGGNAGAFYLFGGLTGALISAAVGSGVMDRAGAEGVTVLGNGNYVVRSFGWNSRRGAVTWGSDTAGVSGAVSAANSLVGLKPVDQVGTGDLVGSGGVTALSNGNYVVGSPSWNANRGAATWGDGTAGVTGVVSAANSLVGANHGDAVGSGLGVGVTALSNGNYVVLSPFWNGHRGAATWGDGAVGVTGVVSAANSLVGANPFDRVGFDPPNFSGGITTLSNGNYVVRSPSWSSDRGAVTWGDGMVGVTGVVSAANSLVGSNVFDRVGFNGVTALSNGNYVVFSPNWNFGRGAATWADGTTGVTGIVSAANSLVGSNAGEAVGAGVTALSNGNYVVFSPNWNFGRGAATWRDGTTGITGVVSPANSLIGSNPGEAVGAGVTALSNGNYVVRSPSWNGSRGAATWGNGRAGITGVVSAANSLVGANSGDQVGIFPVTALSSGNYVVRSPHWNIRRGAATWGDGTTGITGVVSPANSLVGANPFDCVAGSDFFIGGITSLSNGNYVVRSPDWNGARGAATWGNGTTGVIGVLSAANSLTGSNPGDFVGDGVTALSNGNYVIRSPAWNGQRGAGTWGDGTIGVTGVVSAANSLVGADPFDRVGFDPANFSGGVTALSNGNYIVHSPFWSSGRGAVTPVNGSSGQTADGRGAVVSSQNSLVGQSLNARLSFAGENPVAQSFLASSAIGTGRVSVGVTDPDPNQFTFDRFPAQTLTFTPGFLTRVLNTGTAVVLQASNDITVNSPIAVNNPTGNGGALTLQAGRSILLNAGISTDNGDLTLIANDTLASGVVDSQRDPGNAVITSAAGLGTGSGTLTVELRDGAGRTNRASGAITLQGVFAGPVSVVNNGPSAGSDVSVGTVVSFGPQSYANPNGTTRVEGILFAVDRPLTFHHSVVVSDGRFVGAGTSTVNFASGETQMLETGSAVIFGNVDHTGTGTLRLADDFTVTGTFRNTAGTFDANDQPVMVTGVATVAGGTYRAGTATQTFLGGLVIAGGQFTSSTGPMSVPGPVMVTGGLLSGSGTVGPLTALSGTVAPGQLFVDGAVTFLAAATFRARLDGPTPGSQYSQLMASGPVDLGGAELSLVLGFEPELGNSFELIATSDPAGVTGTFAGLDEGAIFDVDGLLFQITYGGGRVVVTRVG